MTDREEALADLGQYIRAQREIARLSLRHLARMTKVSDSYLSQVERGLYQPSPACLVPSRVGSASRRTRCSAGLAGSRPTTAPLSRPA